MRVNDETIIIINIDIYKVNINWSCGDSLIYILRTYVNRWWYVMDINYIIYWVYRIYNY